MPSPQSCESPLVLGDDTAVPHAAPEVRANIDARRGNVILWIASAIAARKPEEVAADGVQYRSRAMRRLLAPAAVAMGICTAGAVYLVHGERPLPRRPCAA